MLATAGLIGADARVPGMALMRAPLGQRGSLLPTGINVLQGVGWTIFELLVIATAAAALSDELFGFRAQWLWTIVFGACALVLALLGPIGFVRRFIRRFAVWAVPLALVYLTWWALDGADLGALWDAEGEGGLSVWQGADVVVGITVSWVPYAADYTRFSKTTRGAFAGTGLGYFVPDAWLLALGAVLVLSRGLDDPAALPAAVVAGGFAAIVALFALLVTETDEAFANAYSAAVSLQNAFPRAPQALLIVLVTGVATLGALVIDMGSYQSFLLLLGSVFVPLFAVLLADWLVAGAHYATADVFDSPPWRAGLIGAWIAGFALYQWLFPTGPSWWVDARGGAEPAGLGHRRDGSQLPRLVRHRAGGRARDASGRRRSRDRVTTIAALGNISPRRRRRWRPAPGRRGLLVDAGARAPGSGRNVHASCSAEAPAGAPPAARGVRPPRHLARVVDDDRVQLPLRGRPADHVAGRGGRPLAARAGRRGRGRRDVGQRLRAHAHGLPAGDARRARGGRTTAARRPAGSRPHGDDRAAADRRAHRRRARSHRGPQAERRGGRDARRKRGTRAAARARRARGHSHARLAGSLGRDADAHRARRGGPGRGEVDPTGAGDTYSVTYLVQRAAGAEPVEAARVAAATVSAFLARS